jgi:hypothetical protein
MARFLTQLMVGEQVWARGAVAHGRECTTAWLTGEKRK